ncbi:MAG: M56 family metallopeptidase [Thermoleophilia bacterium]|nr:M56 family metallopeptidase [Thermoleophilia bacterium]
MPILVVVAVFSLLMVGATRLLPLDRVAPPIAIACWLCVLAVGAITTVLATGLVVVFFPETAIYSLIAGWCVHVSLPVFSPHIGLSGHSVLHAAMVVPASGLPASMFWLLSRLTNGWWALRNRLQSSIKTNQGWTLIEDESIVMGVAPLGRSRIVVSDAAVRAMDPDELEAGLCHETGHIRRGHRSILLTSRVLAALGFAFPGTRQAQRDLHQALERDADDYAVRQTKDPLALASAICKAATGPQPAGGISLGGGRIGRRLDYLEDDLTLVGPYIRRGMRLVALTFVAGTLMFAVSASTWVAGSSAGGHASSISSNDC